MRQCACCKNEIYEAEHLFFAFLGYGEMFYLCEDCGYLIKNFIQEFKK